MIRVVIGAVGLLRPSNLQNASFGRMVCATVCFVLMGCSEAQLSVKPPRTVPAAAAADVSKLRPAQAQSPIDGEDEFVVRVVAPGTTCSGTLISASLVLTAHHCVSVHDAKGRIFNEDSIPSQIKVELGSANFRNTELRVQTVITPDCGYAAGLGDLAILVLSEPLLGVRTLEPMLDREIAVGDRISHLGFGRCALSSGAIQLRHRAPGVVDLVTHGTFRGTVPLCPGDSGGPVVLQNGGLIGVVSAGAMDGDENTADRAEFARLDYFRALFGRASSVVEGRSLQAGEQQIGCDELDAMSRR